MAQNRHIEIQRLSFESFLPWVSDCYKFFHDIKCIVQYINIKAMKNPTEEAYTELQKAYDFFNHALFESKLPPCLITLQRKARTYGYFSPSRFEHTQIGTLTDEISMNPDHFKT